MKASFLRKSRQSVLSQFAENMSQKMMLQKAVDSPDAADLPLSREAVREQRIRERQEAIDKHNRDIDDFVHGSVSGISQNHQDILDNKTIPVHKDHFNFKEAMYGPTENDEKTTVVPKLYEMVKKGLMQKNGSHLISYLPDDYAKAIMEARPVAIGPQQYRHIASFVRSKLLSSDGVISPRSHGPAVIRQLTGEITNALTKIIGQHNHATRMVNVQGDPQKEAQASTHQLEDDAYDNFQGSPLDISNEDREVYGLQKLSPDFGNELHKETNEELKKIVENGHQEQYNLDRNPLFRERVARAAQILSYREKLGIAVTYMKKGQRDHTGETSSVEGYNVSFPNLEEGKSPTKQQLNAASLYVKTFIPEAEETMKKRRTDDIKQLFSDPMLKIPESFKRRIQAGIENSHWLYDMNAVDTVAETVHQIKLGKEYNENVIKNLFNIPRTGASPSQKIVLRAALNVFQNKLDDIHYKTASMPEEKRTEELEKSLDIYQKYTKDFANSYKSIMNAKRGKNDGVLFDSLVTHYLQTFPSDLGSLKNVSNHINDLYQNSIDLKSMIKNSGEMGKQISEMISSISQSSDPTRETMSFSVLGGALNNISTFYKSQYFQSGLYTASRRNNQQQDEGLQSLFSSVAKSFLTNAKIEQQIQMSSNNWSAITDIHRANNDLATSLETFSGDNFSQHIDPSKQVKLFDLMRKASARTLNVARSDPKLFAAVNGKQLQDDHNSLIMDSINNTFNNFDKRYEQMDREALNDGNLRRKAENEWSMLYYDPNEEENDERSYLDRRKDGVEKVYQDMTRGLGVLNSHRMKLSEVMEKLRQLHEHTKGTDRNQEFQQLGEKLLDYYNKNPKKLDDIHYTDFDTRQSGDADKNHDDFFQHFNNHAENIISQINESLKIPSTTTGRIAQRGRQIGAAFGEAGANVAAQGLKASSAIVKPISGMIGKVGQAIEQRRTRVPQAPEMPQAPQAPEMPHPSIEESQGQSRLVQTPSVPEPPRRKGFIERMLRRSMQNDQDMGVILRMAIEINRQEQMRRSFEQSQRHGTKKSFKYNSDKYRRIVQ